MNSYPWTSRVLALVLATLLCGAPAMLAQTADAQSSTDSTTQLTPQSDQTATPQQRPSQSLDVDPSKGPLEPVPEEQLPEAPSAQRQPAPAQTTTLPPAPQRTAQQPVEPEGTAAAKSAATAGGPASKPAGSAIAPAKQRQVRSLLIKVGAIAAGGAALGIIYGLTRGTSSTPPNSTAAGVTQAH